MLLDWRFITSWKYISWIRRLYPRLLQISMLMDISKQVNVGSFGQILKFADIFVRLYSIQSTIKLQIAQLEISYHLHQTNENVTR